MIRLDAAISIPSDDAKQMPTAIPWGADMMQLWQGAAQESDTFRLEVRVLGTAHSCTTRSATER